jgi:hypothetical protein
VPLPRRRGKDAVCGARRGAGTASDRMVQSLAIIDAPGASTTPEGLQGGACWLDRQGPRLDFGPGPIRRPPQQRSRRLHLARRTRC